MHCYSLLDYSLDYVWDAGSIHLKMEKETFYNSCIIKERQRYMAV